MKKTNDILNEFLKKIEPSKEELEKVNDSIKKISGLLNREIKRLSINAEIFIGGSFAKGTVIKKDNYDVDIFVRFDEKYRGQDLSKLLEKIIKKFPNVLKVHGSRDYFRIKESKNFFIELIPVIKAQNPKNSENITDLSYSHVKYINKKIKSKKILDDIKVTKSFCYSNNCYGAESYIKGFSGYAIELLINYYGGFLKFVKALAKHKTGKIIIDIEKNYNNKNKILLDMNSSKLESPIILVDPTYPQRNALAALSKETFEKFKNTCRNFLKNPSINAFEIKKINLEKIKADALKKRDEFILLEAATSKQKGDIAGSKLLKFYKYLEKEIAKYFEIKNKGFEYGGEKTAEYFFVVKSKKELILSGPFEKDEKNVKMFRKEHKNIFVKKGKIYARKKINFSVKEFIENWKKKYDRKIKEMSIGKLIITSQ